MNLKTSRVGILMKNLIKYWKISIYLIMFSCLASEENSFNNSGQTLKEFTIYSETIEIPAEQTLTINLQQKDFATLETFEEQINKATKEKPFFLAEAILDDQDTQPQFYNADSLKKWLQRPQTETDNGFIPRDPNTLFWITHINIYQIIDPKDLTIEFIGTKNIPQPDYDRNGLTLIAPILPSPQRLKKMINKCYAQLDKPTRKNRSYSEQINESRHNRHQENQQKKHNQNQKRTWQDQKHSAQSNYENY
ncbi:MAG: hypothetical protein UR26_C0001G0159 [candidate division TM6 bacterium GW2011_GWF2_32_72]|nr:MAG: hypothetical protein UR26_C0001G0159 [candidate division TM6 bacterium GW2011_GWF2_32_72]